jgi:hypothetical protein
VLLSSLRRSSGRAKVTSMPNREATPTTNLRPFKDYTPAFCPDPWRVMPPPPERAQVQAVSSPPRKGEERTVVFLLPAARP